MSSSHRTAAATDLKSTGPGVSADTKSTESSAMELFALGMQHSYKGVLCMQPLNTHISINIEDIKICYQAKVKENDSNSKIANYFEGYEYYFGLNGKVKNDQKAWEHFQKSADRGLAAAQSWLGEEYLKRNEKIAIEWFQKAAIQEDALAQYYLGRIYEDGLGTERNLVVSTFHHRLAAMQGFIPAIQVLQNRLELTNCTGDEVFTDFYSTLDYHAEMGLPAAVTHFRRIAWIGRRKPQLFRELWSADIKSPYDAIVKSAYSKMEQAIDYCGLDKSEAKGIQQIMADLGLKKMEKIEEANHFEEAEKLFFHLNPVNLSAGQNFEIGTYLINPKLILEDEKDRLNKTNQMYEKGYPYLRAAALAGNKKAWIEIARPALSMLKEYTAADKNEEYLARMPTLPATFEMFCRELEKLVATAKDSKDELSESGSLNPAESQSASVSDQPKLMVIDKKKIEELTKEAASGSATAQFRLAFVHSWGVGGVAIDIRKAFDLTLQAAKQGHRDAQYNLGMMQRNSIDAHNARSKVGKQGNGDQQYDLALLHGHRVENDLNFSQLMSIEKSNDWLQAAASQGHIEAQNKLRPAFFSPPSRNSRISYNEILEYVNLCPGVGNATYRGRSVRIVTSVAGDSYDENSFVNTFKHLLAERPPHIADVLAIAHYNTKDAKKMPTAPLLGQPAGSVVPQLVAVYEQLHGPTLADAISRAGMAARIDYKIRMCLQIARAIDYLHSPYSHGFCGDLTSSSIRIDESSGNIKLEGINVSQHADSSKSIRSMLYGYRFRHQPQPPFESLLSLPLPFNKVNLEAKQEAKINRYADVAYWAPERFLYPHVVTNATDIYAFGCVMGAIFMWKEPFAGQSFEAIKAAVLGGARPVRNKSKIPLALNHLISECLAAELIKRPSISACIDRLKNISAAVNLDILGLSNEQNIAACYSYGEGAFYTSSDKSSLCFFETDEYINEVIRKDNNNKQTVECYLKYKFIQTKKDPAFVDLTQLAEQGLVHAQYVLAKVYRKIIKDYKMACEWYQKAATQGHGLAQYELAEMYHSFEIKINLEAAAWYYRLAAVQGYPKAISQLCDLTNERNFIVDGKVPDSSLRIKYHAAMCREECSDDVLHAIGDIATRNPKLFYELWNHDRTDKTSNPAIIKQSCDKMSKAFIKFGKSEVKEIQQIQMELKEENEKIQKKGAACLPGSSQFWRVPSNPGNRSAGEAAAPPLPALVKKNSP